MITIADLIAPVTADQTEESFLLIIEGTGLKPRAWRDGGALRTILRIIAVVFAAFTNLISQFAASGFLETSTAGWLTLLAYSVYGVTRIPSTFASGTVTLFNGGGGVYNVAAGAFRCTSSVTGKAYTNVSGFILNPGSTLDVPVTAVELGADSNAAPGTVTLFTTTPLAGVTCTNAAAIVGSDAETDPVLRQRCKDKLGTVSGLGPRGAYSYAVRSAVRADGSAVDVNRLSISPSSSTGIVTIYCASPAGAPLATDLDFVRASVELYARPDSVTATVIGANPLPVSKTLTVWAVAQTGVSATDLTTLVQAALLAMITTYPIGGIAKTPDPQGYLFSTRIEGAVIGAHASIFAVDGVGADVLMSAGDVATLATTITIRIVTKEV
jgi:hypothetical protein